MSSSFPLYIIVLVVVALVYTQYQANQNPDNKMYGTVTAFGLLVVVGLLMVWKYCTPEGCAPSLANQLGLAV